MLCQSCRRSIFARLPLVIQTQSLPSLLPSLRRSESTASVRSKENSPAKLSSSIAITKSESASLPTSPPSELEIPSKPPRELRGSIAGGKELAGIGYLKSKPKILAKEDDEYPDWLWTLLDDGQGKVGGSGTKVDIGEMTRKQRAKHDRKQEKLRQNSPQIIPVHEQSKDLTAPGDDAVVSLKRRQEIIRSSRVARRKSIREDNFLRGM